MNKRQDNGIPYFTLLLFILFFNLIFLYVKNSLAFGESHSSVVVIENDNKEGSGFVIEKHNVITNAHVCMVNYEDFINGSDAIINENLIIKTKDGEKLISKSVKILTYTDLCLIKVDKFLTSMLIKYDYKPSYGDFLTMHPPHKYGGVINTVYAGLDKIKDSLTKYHQNSHLLMGKGKSGMSGSPIVNNNGLVIGVMWGTAKYKDFIYYISIDELKPLMDNN